jgi:nucleotide-binding universal stress UspA family protein
LKKGLEVEIIHKVGIPFVEIIRAAKEKKTDLIVMATHGRSGLSHILFGSVAEKVVRKSTCPVLSIRPREHEFTMP